MEKEYNGLRQIVYEEDMKYLSLNVSELDKLGSEIIPKNSSGIKTRDYIEKLAQERKAEYALVDNGVVQFYGVRSDEKRLNLKDITEKIRKQNEEKRGLIDEEQLRKNMAWNELNDKVVGDEDGPWSQINSQIVGRENPKDK